jgi:hypothetical protein
MPHAGREYAQSSEDQIRPAVLRKAESAAERHGGVNWFMLQSCSHGGQDRRDIIVKYGELGIMSASFP